MLSVQLLVAVLLLVSANAGTRQHPHSSLRRVRKYSSNDRDRHVQLRGGNDAPDEALVTFEFDKYGWIAPSLARAREHLAAWKLAVGVQELLQGRRKVRVKRTSKLLKQDWKNANTGNPRWSDRFKAAYQARRRSQLVCRARRADGTVQELATLADLRAFVDDALLQRQQISSEQISSEQPAETESGVQQSLPSADGAEYDYDLVVIGGGSGGLACAKEVSWLLLPSKT